MTNQWDDEDEYDNEDEGQSRGQSRGPNLVNDLRKQLKAKDKLLTEQAAQLKELGKTTRTNTIQSFLKDKGVNTKLARYIPPDIEATDEALTTWLKEDGELFGIKPGDGQKQEEAPVVEEEVFTPDDLGQLRQITGAMQGGVVTPGKESDMLAKLNSFKSADEMTAFLQSQGMNPETFSIE